MPRDYLFTFSPRPSDSASLAPTFINFVSSAGATIAPPSITETYAGTGFYTVNYNATQTVFFTMDGATTGLATSQRYIAGVFDPQDMFGSTLTGMGSTIFGIGNTVGAIGVTFTGFNATFAGQAVTLVAIGNTVASIASFGATFTAFGSLMGDTTSSFGSTSADPTTVFGFLKRAQEISEGNETYTKATGILDMFSRGSSTLLREKTISDSTSSTTKT